MLGFQAEGAAPIVRGHPIEKPQTVATAIRIGNPASWKAAVAARDESGGLIDMVTDAEIIDAYKLLAASDGVFVEPASAAGIAGIRKLAPKGYFPKGSTLGGHAHRARIERSGYRHGQRACAHRLRSEDRCGDESNRHMKIRNPNPEIRNKLEARADRMSTSRFDYSDLFRDSNFDIRV